MKTPRPRLPLILTTTIASAAALLSSHAQGFLSGSTGADGALLVTANRVLDLPSDGIFHFTTIEVRAGATLSFKPNALNTPVHLLATGNVVIEGRIEVNAGNGSANPPVGGLGGPGGFNGGNPGTGAIPPGAGYGPGGARGGTLVFSAPGTAAGSFGSVGNGGSNNRSTVYGSPLLVPLIGGSGGGGTTGTPGTGGGGGGGAVLIASSTSIHVPGAIEAIGGNGIVNAADNGGSGGAIRLVAPKVSGAGFIRVGGSDGGGFGRSRVDTLDRRDLALRFEPTGAATVGSLMMVFPTPRPRLDIIGLATTLIPAGTNAAVFVQLPFGAPTNQVVRVQATDFSAIVPIRILLTPDNGEPRAFDFQIDNRQTNPAVLDATVGFHANTQVAVQVFTRPGS
ncbi:MAG: hypothetical protein AB7O66_08175 [Limisphaerales bacterium]